MNLGNVAIACLVAVCVVNPAAAQRPSTHTYKGQDGTFAIEYRDPLIACRKAAQSWEPMESCDACGDSDIACVAYPTEKVAGTNFVSGTFSVGEIPDARDQTACLTGMGVPDFPTPASRKIHGVTFRVVHRDGVASGTAAETYQYRAFHGSKCYELNVGTSSMNPEIADPGVIKKLPESTRRKIDAILERALDSFRFLK
ncbi:MAG: hypothetical protein LAN83_00810 [Acidobacteriia bacterium]|nr:hypothetical protein [Terriglobia bacterium]